MLLLSKKNYEDGSVEGDGEFVLLYERIQHHRHSLLPILVVQQPEGQKARLSLMMGQGGELNDTVEQVRPCVVRKLVG